MYAQRPGDADRAHRVAGLPMGGVGPFPALDGRREVELEVGGAGQALDGVGRRGREAGAVEGEPGASGVAGAERGPTFGQQLLDRRGHPTIIAPPVGAGRPPPHG